MSRAPWSPCDQRVPEVVAVASRVRVTVTVACVVGWERNCSLLSNAVRRICGCPQPLQGSIWPMTIPSPRHQPPCEVPPQRGLLGPSLSQLRGKSLCFRAAESASPQGASAAAPVGPRVPSGGGGARRTSPGIWGCTAVYRRGLMLPVVGVSAAGLGPEAR